MSGNESMAMAVGVGCCISWAERICDRYKL